MGKIIKTLMVLVMFITIPSFIYSQESNSEATSDSITTELNSTQEIPDDTFIDTSSNTNETQFKSPSMVWYFVRMIIVLICIVAACYAIMLFFKKKNNVSKSEDDYLRKVSTLTLSPGKTIEIVTLLDQAYILGVTDSGINLIDEIKDKELISALNLNFDNKQNVKKPMNFNDVLQMFVSKNKTKQDIYSDINSKVDNLSNKE